jgi:hypothetical protein
MITKTGKNIIAKYLIGQAPAFASFMAFGCGAKPLADTVYSVTYRAANSSTKVVTITTSVAHSFVPGSYVRVETDQAAINGVYKIKTVPSDVTFTYIVSSISENITVNGSPLSGSTAVADYSNKQALDFEMFRVPITSRGYITENGVSQVVLTAELPTEERYEISEVGIFSARANPLASSNDSRILLKFSESENWEYHQIDGTEEIPYISAAIGNDIGDYKALQLNANNPTFDNDLRKSIYESPRLLNRSYLVSGSTATLKKEVIILSAIGDGSKIVYTTDVPHTLKSGDVVTISGLSEASLNFASATISATPNTKTFEVSQPITATSTTNGVSTTRNLVIHQDSEHIHLNGFNINLNKNAPTDELVLAFSVINKDSTQTTDPASVRILIEFANTDSSAASQHARFEVDLQNGNGSLEDGSHDFSTNRYVSIRKQLKDLPKTAAFNWGDVATIKAYASVLDSSGVPTSDYFIAFDALRLENLTTISPIYGLTGYSVVTNSDKSTIIKEPNTSTLTEFRFGMDVQ